MPRVRIFHPAQALFHKIFTRDHKMKLLTILFVLSLVTVTVPISISAQANASPETLRRLADDYYDWRNQNYPVSSSDAGLHTWDNKLTDYSGPAVAARRAHVPNLLAQVN